MRQIVLLAGLLALSACQSVVQGPSRLAGQPLEAVVALYGPWAEQITIQDRPLYIWRRTLIAGGQASVCELRVEVGFRQAITRAYLQGVPEACKLYAVREESLAK
jgi:hypothetical protein